MLKEVDLKQLEKFKNGFETLSPNMLYSLSGDFEMFMFTADDFYDDMSEDASKMFKNFCRAMNDYEWQKKNADKWFETVPKTQKDSEFRDGMLKYHANGMARYLKEMKETAIKTIEMIIEENKE